MPAGDPGRQVASLREALMLVRGIAGDPPGPSPDALLDEAALISSAYEQARPVTQRRFDALSAEIAAWAAAGLEALVAAGDQPPRSPAARLADRLDEDLARLRRLLGL